MSPKTFLSVLGLIVLFCYTAEGRILSRKHEAKRSIAASLNEPDHISSAESKDVRGGSIFKRKRRESPPASAESSESIHLSSAEAKELIKFFMAEAWKSQKDVILGSFLDEIADSDTNITVVGWKLVNNTDGSLKELRTIEFVVPPKPDTDDNVGNFEDVDDEDEEDDDDDRTIPWNTLNSIKEIFEPFSILGVPVSISAESFDKHGDQEDLVYLSREDLFVKADGFAIYNRTTSASADQVEQFIANTKGIGKTTILRFDENGQLKDNSVVAPLLLGMVTDYNEASDEILQQSPEIIARVSQKYPQNEIPKELASVYNEKWPEYQWRVLVNPINHYLSRDISVSVTYDNLDLYENSYVGYLVYGKKKATGETN